MTTTTMRKDLDGYEQWLKSYERMLERLRREKQNQYNKQNKRTRKETKYYYLYVIPYCVDTECELPEYEAVLEAVDNGLCQEYGTGVERSIYICNVPLEKFEDVRSIVEYKTKIPRNKIMKNPYVYAIYLPEEKKERKEFIDKIKDIETSKCITITLSPRKQSITGIHTILICREPIRYPSELSEHVEQLYKV